MLSEGWHQSDPVFDLISNNLKICFFVLYEPVKSGLNRIDKTLYSCTCGICIGFQ